MLNDRQRLFVAEYMKDLNATRAAIRAGYSKRSAHNQGQRMIKNDYVGAAIAQAMRERVERVIADGDDVLRELTRLGLSDMRDHVEWGPDGVKLKESAGLTDGAAAAVKDVSMSKEVRYDKNGDRIETVDTTVKLHDKKGPLELLARHLGLFPKDSGVNINQYTFDLSGVPTDELKRVKQLIDRATVPPVL